jgi:hypothetical protein
MSIRNRLFNSIFFRSMLTSFGNRSPYSSKTKDFTAYFQYKIGPYQADYCLYFAKQPFLQVYKNEIFNKMYEYEGYDLIRYLETHYEAYEDKADFIRFLWYEISERQKQPVPKTHKLKLQLTSDWLAEKQGANQAAQERSLKTQIEDDVRSTLDGQGGSNYDFDKIVHALSEKLAGRLDQVLSTTEEKMSVLTESLITGNIELNNQHNLIRLIHLYLLIQSIEIVRGSSAEKLFKRNSNMDLASILHLHYRAFKGKQINTVQAQISKAGEDLKINDPKVQKLTKALTEFFY